MLMFLCRWGETWGVPIGVPSWLSLLQKSISIPVLKAEGLGQGKLFGLTLGKVSL